MDAAELPKKFLAVNSVKMAYFDSGPGENDQGEQLPTLWFQHGNPTSSYLWRHTVRALSGKARCIAPDLVGMGDSASLPKSGTDSYSFSEHFEFLSALLDKVLPAGPVIPVLHDWGSALGFHWSLLNPERIAGLVYMEAIVQPVSWEDWPENARDIFQAMRSEAGEQLVLEKNIFVEKILPASIIRTLNADEMDVYRRPFLVKGEARRPTLSWPRQIPINGVPEDVAAIVDAYGVFLKNAPMPKLFINAEPGSILLGEPRAFCRTWANQEEVTVPGIHFIQEDSGAQIGTIIAKWLQSVRPIP